MKRILSSFFLFAALSAQCLLLTSCDSQAQSGTPRVFEIYLSPDLPEATREELKKQIQYFIAGVEGKPGMQTGDVLTIRDGASTNPIGEEVNTRKQDRIPKLRLKNAEATVQSLKSFLDSPKSTEGRSALNLAKILSTRQTQPNTRILVIGSPIYHDDVEAHDMRRGWLSDGYFNQPPQITTFSVQGKQANLQNARISIATVGAEWGAGAEDNHRRGVERFWAIFTQENGGTLVYFDQAVEGGLKSLMAENPAEVAIVPPRDKEDKKLAIHTGKIEILRPPEQQTIQSGETLTLRVDATGPEDSTYQWFKNGQPIPEATQSVYTVESATLEHNGDYTVRISSGADTVTTSPVRIEVQQTISASQASPNPAPTPEPVAAPTPLPPITPDGPAPDWLTQPVEDYRRSNPEPPILPGKDYLMIGLRWPTDRNHNQDLDLHVRPLSGKEELSFRNTKTSEGIHYKDFQTNPNANHGYEVVELLVPVAPESVEVWVNAYSGKDPEGFTGEVRLYYAGALRAFPFEIQAKSGNQGADVIRRTTSPHWTRINLSTK